MNDSVFETVEKSSQILKLDFSSTEFARLAEEQEAAFEDLYQRMHGMPLREMDRIVDAVCTLCREHEKAGFVEGVKTGIMINKELKK